MRRCNTALKFVVITNRNLEEIEPGAHLAYTLSYYGFIYWHEAFVAKVDWDKKLFMVYERTKTRKKGMYYNELPMIYLLDRRLCRMFIYTECLSFEKSVQLATEMLGDTYYDGLRENCEHTVRFLKTGVKESLQVRDSLSYIIDLVCGGSVPKFLRVPVRSVSFASMEILCDNVCHWFAPNIDVMGIGADSTAAAFLFLIFYFFRVIKLRKQLKKEEISEDNFMDLHTILRYKLFGAAVGSIAGVLMTLPLGIKGIAGVVLLCLVSCVCSLVFSISFENNAYWVIKKRHNRRLSRMSTRKLLVSKSTDNTFQKAP